MRRNHKSGAESSKHNETQSEGAPPTRPLVVGIGASAGGLGAFKTFFKHMPADSGMAFVLVQHLDPNHKSMLADLLSQCTDMTVAEASDGIEVAPDHVFIIPPDATLTIHDGGLQVDRPAPARANRHPIDTFFSSLAEDQGENAVCVILSGAGNDGTLGLRKIKECGGFALAQEGAGDSASGGMPASASATGLVDYTVGIDKMPGKLVEYQKHMHNVQGRKSADGTRKDAAHHLSRITELVRDRLGHDFSQYKENTLVRRVQRRMQVLQVDAVPEYIQRLEGDLDELRLLFADLLIGVTQFFRDSDAWQVLEKTVIPKLFENKTAADEIRIWVPACGTGEEAYSIAILLQEAMDRTDAAAPTIQVFGTDIDQNAIQLARAGTYHKSAPGLSQERRERYFTADGEGDIKPLKSIRAMCVFAEHSVVKDPPFSKLDLISCRNLLIYMNNDLQDHVVRKFHYALKPNAWLFLGASEGVSRSTALFDTVDKKHRLFQCLESDQATAIPDIVPTAAPSRRDPPNQASHAHENTRASDDVIDRQVQRAMEKHTMPYVVVNNDRVILRFSGGAVGAYLEPSAGAASFELMGMVKKTLRPAVRDAVQETFATGEAVTKRNLPLRIGGEPHGVTVIVEPLDSVGTGRIPYCVVAFRDTGTGQPDRGSGEAGSQEGVATLEHELRVTKAQLNAAINDLETANEEMRSANEEYQSVNEELQSSNEELETSKEEMQSVNEELQTVNSELTQRTESLTKANSDLRNLLESTQIATLFLDPDLRIRSYTPGMNELFHLRDSDRGRPVTDIVTRLDYNQLKRDAEKVLRDLNLVEHEVNLVDDKPRTFIMRIRPYRTVENVIDGIVITFTDITERKRGETERTRLAELVKASHDGIISHSLDGTVLSWNAAAERMFGHPASEAIGKPLAMLIPEGQSGEMPRLLEKLQRGEPVDPYRVVREMRDGSHIDVELTISPIGGRENDMVAASTVARDVTARRQHEAHRDLLMHELSHRVKNTLSTVQSVMTQTSQSAADLDQFTQAFGQRLRALSDTHNLLIQAHWSEVQVADVVVTELQPYGTTDTPQWQMHGEEVHVAPRQAITLGLALHELTTNAAKYGALSNTDGRVDIRWRVEHNGNDQQLHLAWTEHGGPPVTKPERRGFGSRLIEEGLSYELDAEVSLDFQPGGVCCRIRVPLTNRSPVAAATEKTDA